jgi:large subunit ribosomal protein L30
VVLDLKIYKRLKIDYEDDKMADRIRITQVKSTIGRPAKHGRIIRSLGLRKMNYTVEHTADPVILGQVKKVSHLVKVEEV